jgi:hypothetical protein
MNDKAKRSRRQAPIWGAPLAPIRNGCAMTSGSASGPTSCRHLPNRLRSTIASKTPTNRAPASLAANTHRRPFDRIPKDDPPSQAA